MSSSDVESERRRQDALRSCQILDTPREESFDELAQVAAELCGAPMAAVSFLAADRQWFKARVGLNRDETSRSEAICALTIQQEEPLVVGDTWGDPRFADLDILRGDPPVRFYAGVPLRIESGPAIGTLCVMDHRARTLSSSQLAGLEALARHIQRELRLRRDLAAARRELAPGKLPVQEGDLLGGTWRLVRRIGEGAVGVVFEAYDRSTRRVAIKFLQSQWMARREVVDRFVREARIMARLGSPHACKILDVGNLPAEHGDAPYLVMEYLEGTDLEATLRQRHRVAWPQALRWAIDLCQVLAEAHDLGIVHRDLKPANVFLARNDRDEEVIKLVDFGIAKEALPPDATPLTAVDHVLGSLFYMPPEQLTSSHAVDIRADVWALGVLLYELITGRVPFDGKTPLEVCLSVMRRPPLPLRAGVSEAPAPLEAVVRRCLQRDPEARYPGVRELASDLAAVLEAR